jgi:RhtB (resistance to homoserine/threonine) family protein
MTMTLDPQIVAFTTIAGLLTLTPGADTMLVMRNVMARGRGAGLCTTMGSCCGVFLHATLSALGLSLILVRSAMVFHVVKWLGAGYLIWLGTQALRQAWYQPHSASDNVSWTGSSMSTVKGRQSFLEGLLNNILNPKVAIFYLAFLPQFISPGDWVLGKSVLLAAIHWVENLVWLSMVTVCLSRLRAWITQPRVTRAIEATTGALLIAFGARLALERAR